MKHEQPQAGAGLVVALIMLVVMSMAAIAMVRAVGTGMLVAGNFSFRQQALLAADAGSGSNANARKVSVKLVVDKGVNAGNK